MFYNFNICTAAIIQFLNQSFTLLAFCLVTLKCIMIPS